MKLSAAVLTLAATTGPTLLGTLAQDAGYGPDPDGVPADFLCEWRKLAFEYSSHLRPDSGAMVHDALELTKYCNGTVPRPSESDLPKVFPPKTTHVDGALVVDGSTGDDSNPGTVEKPLKTIGAAVSLARHAAAGSPAKTVEVRAGTYYMTTPLHLTEADSGLTIQNYNGEEVWLSGAAPIKELEWELWKPGTNTSMSDPQENTNNAENACGDHGHVKPPGSDQCGCETMASADVCASACLSADNCTSYTYHASSLPSPWTSMCCLRTDGVWDPVSESGHTAAQKTAGHAGIWRATTHGSLGSDDIVTELRVDGARHAAARYPNADPETQYWPIGYLTSQEDFEPKGDWQTPTIQPDPNPATIVKITDPAHSRLWDDYFNEYGGGINGTCAIYDPPFSYWCQSNFSEGCGGCFTWNIPSGMHYDKSALPRAPTYTNVTDAQFFAWRKAHWANW